MSENNVGAQTELYLQFADFIEENQSIGQVSNGSK